MKVAIDHSPLVSTHKMAHKIRGTGFYTKHLINSLKKFHPENTYHLFSQGEKLPSGIDLFHYPYFDPFFLTLPFKKLGKSVITIHDLTPLVFPGLFPIGLKGKFKLKIQQFLASRADAIITDSQCSKLDIEKIFHIDPDKVYPVLLAVGEQFKRDKSDSKKAQIIKKYNLPEEFALYVGDATPNKNLKRLVDAIEMTNVSLVMTGGALVNSKIDKKHPWNQDILYIQEKAKTSGKIFLTGFVPDEDLVVLYNTAMFFIMPSLYEGFGLPILEAASCGTAILTSRSGSIPEVIGDAAIFFDPLDTQDIAEKIEFFSSSKEEREKYASLALKQSKNFSWEKTANETVKVYEKIL